MDKKFPTITEEMRHKILTIVGIVLCVLLTPLLIFNCIMIIQSMVNKDDVPNVGGISPLIVLTESMDPTIKAGDIIFVKSVDPEDIRDGDVISFFDPAGNGTSVVTHRVERIGRDVNGNVVEFWTKGDNNNTADRLPVPKEALVGKWTEMGIPLIGHVALFMSTPYGLIICILVPLAAFVGYEFYRRKKEDQTKQGDVAALMQELEALKAAQAANVVSAGATEEQIVETVEETADAETKE